MNHDTIQIFRWWVSGRENSTQWLIGILSGEIVVFPQTTWLINWFIISSFIRHMPLLVYYIRWKESPTLSVLQHKSRYIQYLHIFWDCSQIKPLQSSVRDLLTDLLKTQIQMDCFFLYLMILHCHCLLTKGGLCLLSLLQLKMLSWNWSIYPMCTWMPHLSDIALLEGTMVKVHGSTGRTLLRFHWIFWVVPICIYVLVIFFLFCLLGSNMTGTCSQNKLMS